MEGWSVERGKSKIPVMGDARKLTATIEELQRQNRFLLGIIEEQRSVIKSQGELLEVRDRQQERIRSHATHLANHELRELRKTLSDVIQTRKDSDYREVLEKKNQALTSKVNVGGMQKAERMMKETQRYYSSEVTYLTELLSSLHSDGL